MTTYIVMGKDKIEASSPEEFVKKMHKENHMPMPSDQDFMVEMARRCKMHDGSEISSDKPANFLADLIAAQFVTEEN